MAKEKQKICSHCEGRIAVEADTCLYCGMPLVAGAATTSVSKESTLLYPPAYEQKSADYMKIDNEFAPKFKSPPPQKEDSFAGIAIPAQAKEEGNRSDFIALLLSLAGSSLLILGLVQGLFSDDGVLRLEWNCKYWFVFCLLAMPLLYFGVRKSKEGES